MEDTGIEKGIIVTFRAHIETIPDINIQVIGFIDGNINLRSNQLIQDYICSTVVPEDYTEQYEKDLLTATIKTDLLPYNIKSNKTTIESKLDLDSYEFNDDLFTAKIKTEYIKYDDQDLYISGRLNHFGYILNRNLSTFPGSLSIERQDVSLDLPVNFTYEKTENYSPKKLQINGKINNYFKEEYSTYITGYANFGEENIGYYNDDLFTARIETKIYEYNSKSTNITGRAVIPPLIHRKDTAYLFGYVNLGTRDYSKNVINGKFTYEGDSEMNATPDNTIDMSIILKAWHFNEPIITGSLEYVREDIEKPVIDGNLVYDYHPGYSHADMDIGMIIEPYDYVLDNDVFLEYKDEEEDIFIDGSINVYKNIYEREFLARIRTSRLLFAHSIFSKISVPKSAKYEFKTNIEVDNTNRISVDLPGSIMIEEFDYNEWLKQNYNN